MKFLLYDRKTGRIYTYSTPELLLLDVARNHNDVTVFQNVGSLKDEYVSIDLETLRKE